MTDSPYQFINPKGKNLDVFRLLAKIEWSE